MHSPSRKDKSTEKKDLRRSSRQKRNGTDMVDSSLSEAASSLLSQFLGTIFPSSEDNPALCHHLFCSSPFQRKLIHERGTEDDRRRAQGKSLTNKLIGSLSLDMRLRCILGTYSQQQRRKGIILALSSIFLPQSVDFFGILACLRLPR